MVAWRAASWNGNSYAMKCILCDVIAKLYCVSDVRQLVLYCSVQATVVPTVCFSRRARHDLRGLIKDPSERRPERCDQIVVHSVVDYAEVGRSMLQAASTLTLNRRDTRCGF